MSDQITTLSSMMDATAHVIRTVGANHFDAPTPCDDFTVGGLLEHLAVWVQVFDGAVNDTPLQFDPSTHRIDADWADIFERSTASIVSGLNDRGVDRLMTMTSDPIPGNFVLNMLLMEYVGHGWDLSQAIGSPHPYTAHQASTALDAAQAIIQPEYRGTGMFGAETPIGDDAGEMTAFVAFLGRDPQWSAAND